MLVVKWLRSFRFKRDRGQPLPYVDPLRAGRHPFQIYLLSLCVISGAPYLFGEATAESIETQLPTYLALAWGLSLFFGAGIALIGCSWRGDFVNALTMERIGLYMVGTAGIIYGLALVSARDFLAPMYVIAGMIGAGLIFVPIPEMWRTREGLAADLLSLAGLLLLALATAGLVVSPSTKVLVASFIVLGFGFSCLRRAYDISKIFHRAKELSPRRVSREGEDQ